MAQTLPVNASNPPKTFASGYLFGVPVRDFGWFGSLLVGVASGFITFFAATCASIFGILFYNLATHSTVDLALSYRRVGFPAGILVMAVALFYLATLWLKRVLRRN